jgi:hypothetical protein
MAQPEALDAPPARRRRAVLRGMDNRLVRAVAVVPATVRTKLLVAFLIIAALLVLVGVLGLRVLGQSNARVQRLGTLQLRSSAYETLQAQANELQQQLGLRASGDPGAASLNRLQAVSQGGKHWVLIDDEILQSLSQLSPDTTEALWNFVPPPADERVLRAVRRDIHTTTAAMTALKSLDTAGTSNNRTIGLIKKATTTDTDLFVLATELANRTTQQTAALAAANRSAYASSRNLVITVSGISVVLSRSARRSSGAR